MPTLQRRWRAAPPAPLKDGPARMSRAQREKFFELFFNALRKSKVKRIQPRRNHFQNTLTLVPRAFFSARIFLIKFSAKFPGSCGNHVPPVFRHALFKNSIRLIRFCQNHYDFEQKRLQRRWRAAPPAPPKDSPARRSRAQRENFFELFFACFP